jgi:hypothetical protein
MDTFGLQGKSLFLMEIYQWITHFSLKIRFQNCWQINWKEWWHKELKLLHILIELFPKYPKLGTNVQSQDENNKYKIRGSN